MLFSGPASTTLCVRVGVEFGIVKAKKKTDHRASVFLKSLNSHINITCNCDLLENFFCMHLFINLCMINIMHEALQITRAQHV